MRAHEELQRGQAVLPVDDQEFLIRLLQPPDARSVRPSLEPESLRGEEQHGAGNGRLGDGRLVEVPDGADLGAAQFALKGLVAPLNLGDELGDIVLLLNRVGLDLAALLAVKAADKADGV